MDADSPGSVRYPPQHVVIGREKGCLFFPNAPIYCSRCRQYSHTQAGCWTETVWCTKCRKERNLSKEYLSSVVCNLCNQAVQVYKNCVNKKVKTYSETARSAPRGPWTSEQQRSRPGANDVLDDVADQEALATMRCWKLWI